MELNILLSFKQGLKIMNPINYGISLLLGALCYGFVPDHIPHSLQDTSALSCRLAVLCIIYGRQRKKPDSYSSGKRKPSAFNKIRTASHLFIYSGWGWEIEWMYAYTVIYSAGYGTLQAQLTASNIFAGFPLLCNFRIVKNLPIGLRSLGEWTNYGTIWLDWYSLKPQRRFSLHSDKRPAGKIEFTDALL